MGSSKRNVTPRSAFGRTSNRPPCDSTIVRLIFSPSPIAVRLGGKEGIENSLRVVRPAGPRPGRTRSARPCPPSNCSELTQITRSVARRILHRFHAVEDQIHQHLLDLYRIALHHRQPVREAQLDCTLTSVRFGGQESARPCRTNSFTSVGGRCGSALGDVTPQAADHVGRPLRFVGDLVQHAQQRTRIQRAGLEPPQRALGKVVYRIQTAD